MKKIGILYICTGPYKVFWNEFYLTSEKFFLKNTEKHYFVFSDQNVENTGENDRVHTILIKNMPWPLVTLLRYHFFLSIEEQLKEMDYLMFSNSNMKFVTNVEEDEFLPRLEKNEDLFVVEHPGYCMRPSCYAPFERNRKSTAYVPYSYRGKYVIGAMNGGTASSFLEMARIIAKNTDEDLKHNYIAKWHDESQLNHYIATYHRYRLLTPAFCYPVGFDLPVEKKIVGVSKQDKFDVEKMKGLTLTQVSGKRKLARLVMNKGRAVYSQLMRVRDKILRRTA